MDRKEKVEDWCDRFAEVVKGLGIEKNIANKLANFILYEIETAKKKVSQPSEEVKEKVKGILCNYGYELLMIQDSKCEQQEKIHKGGIMQEKFLTALLPYLKGEGDKEALCK